MTITIGLNECIAIFSAILALFSTYFTYRQYRYFLKEKNNQRILNKNFGSELFGKEVIQSSTYCYVEPNCTDIDPTREAEPKNLLMLEGNIFSLLDKYLLKETPKKDAIHHILILADSGMGKTSFLLNYYAYNLKKSKRKRQRIALIPLGISNVEEYINKINDKENTIIFLDAFDEDTKAIKDHRERLKFLMEKCRQFKRIVITCRTQFFPTDEEIPKETGIIKVAPRKAGEKGIYIFNKLYLSPLSDSQVDEFLKKRFRWCRKKRKKAKQLIQKIPNLKVRPMLLANIPDLIDREQEDIQYSCELYEIMIDNWFEREKRWVNKENLRQFSEKLAFDLYVKREKRGTEKIPINELNELANEWNIHLDNWQITGRSLLNRDAEGNYKFAHRSIMEFLFVVHFFKIKLEERTFFKWTDQQKLFCIDFFKLLIVDLSFVDLSRVNFSRGNFSGANFTYADLSDADLSLSDLSNANFSNANLSNSRLWHTNLKGANFDKSNLSNANFSEADLYEINFSNTSLQGVNLSGTNLSNANLSNTNLSNANLTDANLRNANLKRSNLAGANIEYANFKDANLEDANLLNARIINFKLHPSKRGTFLYGANFKNTKNIPDWVEEELDENGICQYELRQIATRKTILDTVLNKGDIKPFVKKYRTIIQNVIQTQFKQNFIGFNESDIKDIEIEVYNNIYSNNFNVLRNYDSEKGSFVNLLKIIAVQTTLYEIRNKKKALFIRTNIKDSDIEILNSIMEDEANNINLSPMHRTLFKLRYIYNVDELFIARLADKTILETKNILSRIRREVKEKLDNLLEERIL